MPANRGLLRFIIQNQSGQDINDCSQCECCECEFSSSWDLRPCDVILLARNEDNKVFTNHTIWNCENCQECYVNCPNGIDFGAIAFALRREAQKRGIISKADNTED